MITSNYIKKKDNNMTGPLVYVKIGKNAYRKMYKSEAIAQGFEFKEQGQSLDKEVKRPQANKEPSDFVKDDFTEIHGVGSTTAEQLNEHGIWTFDQLLYADVSFLNSRGQSAVEDWQKRLLED
jgi:predicted flap endonuclease-1-like 5' DNA nuclease